MSAAEILAALLAVDGASSGLDADTVDGQQASSFAAANHNHAGVYDPAGTAAALLAGLGGGSVTPLCVAFHDDGGANLTLTNSPSAERFLGNVPGRAIRPATLADGFTQVRLVANVITAGTGSILSLLYKTGAYSATLGDYVDCRSSGETTVALNTTGFKDSGWLTLPVLATGDVFLAVTERGGDAAADPALGYLAAWFR